MGRITLQGQASIRPFICKLFVFGWLLLQFTTDQAEIWFKVRPWCGAAQIFRGYSPILAELCPFEHFFKLFVSSQFLPQFTSSQAET